MPVGEIVAGEWNRVLSTRKLDLVYGKVTLSERRLEARQVEIPHSGETVVIRLRQTAVILIKSLAPLFQRFRIVNPPNFDIRYEQSTLFERRGRLRKRRGITAREYVLSYPGVGCDSSERPANGMQKRDAIFCQNFSTLIEEFRVVAQPYVLKHVDRDNSVKFSSDVPILLEHKAYAIGDTGSHGPIHRNLVLFLGEGNPHYFHISRLRQSNREPAPSRTDTQYVLSKFQARLCGNDTPLVFLCGFKVLTGIKKVCARMLMIRVQETLEELFRQIIVMGNVLPRTAESILLDQS